MSVGVARFLGGLITLFKFLSWHKPAWTSRSKEPYLPRRLSSHHPAPQTLG